MLITSRTLRIAALGLAVVGFSASSVPAFVQADPQAQPDNTKQNKEARSKDAMTVFRDSPGSRRMNLFSYTFTTNTPAKLWSA